MTIITGITREYKEVEREMEKEQVGGGQGKTQPIRRSSGATHDDAVTSLAAVSIDMSHPYGPSCANMTSCGKTGSTQHIATPPGEDRATAIGNKHKMW